MKIVIVINGKGGSGKDTICDIVSSQYETRNISSITPIKEIASAYGGWTGGKTDRDRKFLSDLKELFTKYNDLPTRYCVSEYKKFMSSPTEEVMFVHIREPEQIAHFTNSISGTPVITLLIRGGKSHENYGNKSDDMVENYNYDYVYDNTTTLEDLPSSFMHFFEGIKSDQEQNSYPHEF